MLRRIISYSIIGAATVSTGISLHANDYQVNNLGIVRLARSAVTVFNIGLTYKQQLYYKTWDTNTVEYKIQKGKIHKIAAEKLLDLICINKGVYIKVGQHIGALEYLLPTEYVETMKVLHSNAPQNKVEDLYKVIRQDLKKDPSEIFESFESEPLGTASLAQVHKATLKTGEVVAVKVQHPYVKGNSIVDMKTMEILVKIMAYVFPDFKIQWLVDESKRNLPIELDFVHEGRNAEKVAEMFKPYKWLKVPKIYQNLSTSRVLVMEFLEGAQVTDIAYIKRNNIDRFDIASKIGYLFSHMIFIHGFVHGDPHPGNILIHKNESGSTDIVLLDHGLYADLSEKFRYEYSKFWQSVLNVDEKAMKKHAQNLGLQGKLYAAFACMVTGRTWSSITQGVDKKLFTETEVAEMFKQYSWLKVPKIYQNLSTSRVLVMEFLEGAHVTDLDYIKKNNINRFDIASKIGYLFSHMIFTYGFVHGDPHPGNILIHKNESGSTDIVLLDHGLYADLDEEFRYEYSKFWQSILNVDEKAMEKHATNLGLEGKLYSYFACVVTGRTWETVTQGVDKKLFTQTEVAEMFKQYNWVKVPKIYWDVSTSRVLVMEFLEGSQVTDLDYIKRNNIDHFDIASKIGYLFAHMIFIHGFVHADPHPGNILVHKNQSGSTDIVLLDHGLYAHLSDKFRYEYSKFWHSLLNADEKGMKKHAKHLGLTGRLYVVYACMVTGRTWASITQGVDKKSFTKTEVAAMFKNYKWLKVPKIYWDVSTPRILVMEYLEGGHVNDLNYIKNNKIDRFDVANKIGRLYSDMIFINGFVHSDPHPGNILVYKNNSGNTDIVLLDHGLYANLSEKFRYEYSKLWLSILNVDRDAMKVHAENLGIKGNLYGLFACMLTGRPWESIISGVDRTRYSSNEKELVQNNSALVLPHIADILDQVDRQMLLVLKTNDLIRGIETTLQTQNRMTAFWVMSKCCIKSVYSIELKEVTKFQKFRKTLRKRWEIFKLNLYYLYLGLVNFGLVTSIRQML